MVVVVLLLRDRHSTVMSVRQRRLDARLARYTSSHL
jgi:hypothetical protein